MSAETKKRKVVSLSFDQVTNLDHTAKKPKKTGKNEDPNLARLPVYQKDRQRKNPVSQMKVFFSLT